MWRAFLLLIAAAPGPAQESPYIVEKLIGSLQHASSVVWMRDHLLIADLPAGKLTKVDAEGPSVYREDLHAGAMATDSEGRLYVCDPHEHRVLRFDKKAKLEILAEKYEGKRLNGPTGITVSKNNQVWFTDSAFAGADRDKELGFYGVFHISSKGELTVMARLRGRPDGIALAADQKTLYVVDSDARSVIAWDIDRAGVASSQRVLFRVKDGVPNGITAGTDGKLYVAARNIEIYKRNGEFDSQIEISEKPADIAFGDGENLNMYVAARTSVYRVHFRAKGGKSN